MVKMDAWTFSILATAVCLLGSVACFALGAETAAKALLAPMAVGLLFSISYAVKP